MSELKEWAKVAGEVMIGLLIILAIVTFAMLVIYPFIFETAVETGVTVGEKL